MLSVIKADIITTLQDAIVNTTLTKGYLIPGKYGIHTVGLVKCGGKSGEANLFDSRFHWHPFSRISIGVYGSGRSREERLE